MLQRLWKRKIARVASASRTQAQLKQMFVMGLASRLSLPASRHASPTARRLAWLPTRRALQRPHRRESHCLSRLSVSVCSGRLPITDKITDNFTPYASRCHLTDTECICRLTSTHDQQAEGSRHEALSTSVPVVMDDPRLGSARQPPRSFRAVTDGDDSDWPNIGRQA